MSEKLIRVREFAEQMGCTPQNIYLHLKNYAEELEGHVIDSRQGKLLDEYACEFLRSVMYPRELDANSEVTRLNTELNELRSAFMKLGQENLNLSSRLATTEGERDRALLDVGQYQKLLKSSEEEGEAKLEAAQKETAEAILGRESAEREVAELKELLEQEKAARAAAEADNEALKGRGLLARIFRKGE